LSGNLFTSKLDLAFIFQNFPTNQQMCDTTEATF